MRVGVFGGSFDPPHVGHLLAAVDAHETLELDRLLFIPAAAQPLKVGRVTAPAEDRLAMTTLLVQDDPRFGVDRVEIDRGGLSYMVDTLTTLAGRLPDARLHLLVGADVLHSFAKWREPDRVTELAELVVLARDAQGSDEPAPEAGPAAGARRLATRRVDVSSTEVRARVRAGQSIRGFVPDAVASFIERARLYR